MMDLKDMSVINLMKKNVAAATPATIGDLLQEVPLLVQYADAAPREVKLDLLQVAKSIIDKLLEMDPDTPSDPNWAPYAALYAKLEVAIMETRFAVR